MKELILLALFSLCALTGIREASRLLQRKKLLLKLRRETEQAKDLLLMQGFSPKEAGERMKEKGLWQRAGRMLYRYERMQDAWEAAFDSLLEEERDYALLTKEECSLFRDFGGRMSGCRRREDLKTLFSSLEEALTRSIQLLEAELPQKCRIYPKLGMLFGAALVLFIW